MLYNLLAPLADENAVFNIFRYITFRSGGAVVTALIIAFIMGPRTIRWLKKKQREGQPIRSDGPESHLLTKQGTPTMGGVLILMSLLVSTLLWADLSNGYVWVVIFVTLGYGLIGFGDDYLKLTKRNSRGLRSRDKLIAQSSSASAWPLLPSSDWRRQHRRRPAIPFVKRCCRSLVLCHRRHVRDGRRLQRGESHRRAGRLAIVPAMMPSAATR
jgi:phospho-N-acetylmuramoyl-pentapeptide-transferase